MKIPVIDDFLNSITMYRLTLYYLIGLVSAAILLSFLNILPYNFLEVFFDSWAAITACYIFNFIFSKLFRAQTNIESVFITALILTLIISPKAADNFGLLILASFFAMASKYLVTIGKIHIFNPAAAGVAAVAILITLYPTWWVGTSSMLPFVILGGLLLIRKIEREELIFYFIVPYLFLVSAASLYHSFTIDSIINTLQTVVLRTPLFFFSFVMLTEPLTSPRKVRFQRFYGLITAFLYATPQLRLFGLALTPEFALCIGNIFSYIVNPKYKFFLNLKEKIKISPDIYVFNFGKVENFKFTPGQYMEWTLPHDGTDSRGNRRYFSIASSPSEDLMLAVKFYEPSSSFKKALLGITPDKKIIASSLSGDFVMPENPDTPVAFIAGGVGIAPFRSIIQDIIDKKQKTDVVLIFSNKTHEDLIFYDLLEEAKVYGVRTFYTLTDASSVPANWTGGIGRLNPQMIQKAIPDYTQRIFYISGPSPLVKGFQVILSSMGIPNSKIVVDYFPGYNE